MEQVQSAEDIYEDVRNAFLEAPNKIYTAAEEEGRLIKDLSQEGLRNLALGLKGVEKTIHDSVAADSEPMSRSAMHTTNSVDYEYGEEERDFAKDTVNLLSSETILSVDVVVGNKEDGITARFLMPVKYAQVGYAMSLLFGEHEEIVENPTYQIIFATDENFEDNKSKPLADKDVTIRYYKGDERGEQVKIIRNSIYAGEGKKGVFQFEDWVRKEIDKSGLFLHAGARRDKLLVYDEDSETYNPKEIVTSIMGLTATGKTTTLCASFKEEDSEHSEVIGDDGGTLYFEGGYLAFERGGLYIKTEGLKRSEQPEIYDAAISRDTFFENVFVRDGYPDFIDISKTGNGRAVISRKNLPSASESLYAEEVHNILILTRNPLMNVISELTPEQMTMQLILGESIESSGGDPEKAGTFKREFFLDPFVAGNRIEHAKKFYDIITKNNIKGYLANTGTIGPSEEKVKLETSLAAYNDLLRNRINFIPESGGLGYSRPTDSERQKLEQRLDLKHACAKDMFDYELYLSKIKDFLEGREKYVKDFEEKAEKKGWGKIPDKIRYSLPCSYNEWKSLQPKA